MFEGIPIVGLTAPTLLGITVLLLLTGRIMPRSAYMDKARESELWRQAYEKEREARATSNGQTIELLDAIKTNHAVVSAMFEVVKEKRRSGGPHEAPLE